MEFVRNIPRRACERAIPFACSLILVYLGYHAIQGDRGLLSWLKLSEELGNARTELMELAGERARLEHRVALLRPEGLDRDLLDERARQMLNLARPDEVVIYQRTESAR
ncbi:MAG: septum formation initiator family protein [Proteobacteria bacterium]|nr:septum formation initiator family protein [Pseudomonadota bacterium]